MKEYTEKEKDILEKLYKGPKYWTVQGTLKFSTPGLPGSDYREVSLKRVHWLVLAQYGGVGVLAVHYKKTPVEDSVEWFPYYDLPEVPKLPEKFEDIKKD